jgi:hypothetical protein
VVHSPKLTITRNHTRQHLSERQPRLGFAGKVCRLPTILTRLRHPLPRARDTIRGGEGVRAKLQLMVRCILCKYGYPPDKQEKAMQIVLQPAELLCAEWAE